MDDLNEIECYMNNHVRKMTHVTLYPMSVERTNNFIKANEVNLMKNENNENANEKTNEFKAALAESGVDTKGLDIKPDDSLWDVFMKIGVGKIVVCDDARTFDSSDMDRMREEGRVISEIDVNIDR